MGMQFVRYSRVRRLLQLPGVVRRFRADEKGVTAIEFAILAPPFFLLIFAILESSLIFFAGQVLESSVDQVGRRVRTGELNNTITQAQFRQEVCEAASVLFECSKIKIDMRVAARFQDLGDPPQPDPATNQTNYNGYTFTAPCPEEITMVTASYEWPIFTYFVADHVHPQSAGTKNSAFKKIVLNAISVFRTEPYPAGTGGRAC